MIVKASVENDSLNADTTKSLSEAAARDLKAAKEERVKIQKELTRQKIAERLRTEYATTPKF
jgi:hypothetical protein